MLAVLTASLFNGAILIGLIAGISIAIVRARGAIGDALAFDPLDVRPVPAAGLAADPCWTLA